MRFVLLIFLLPSLQASFGTPQLKYVKLCRIWDCLNKKQGLPDSLPPRETYEEHLRHLLPQGPWQDVVEKVLDVCYGDRPRSYTNTCPGQALLQCVLDQMSEFCPEGSMIKNDGCAPITTLAGMSNYFMQSRFENLEKSLPTEKRPAWFLKNYFNSKCCNLPELFNTSTIHECGATSFIKYLNHRSQPDQVSFVSLGDNSQKAVLSTTPRNTQITSKVNVKNADELKFVDINRDQYSTQSISKANVNNDDELKLVDINRDEKQDPLDCCDMDAFMNSKWRKECDFHMSWDSSRLRIEDQDLTTTEQPTTEQPTTRATPTSKIGNDVKIVPLPNCPHAKKGDPCKHSNEIRDNMLCQISSTKQRPKNRHQFCGLPNMVQHDILSQCDVDSISRLEYVYVTPKVINRSRLSKPVCKDLTPSTTCVLNKMGTLNKYKFMNYFQMRDAIHNFTENSEFAAFREVYLSAFMSIPKYRDHCNSPRKLLNILHTMLMTCPIYKRKTTPQCNRIFADLPVKDKQDEIQRHFDQVFKPKQFPVNLEAKVDSFLSSDSAPPVKIIDIKPTPMGNRPLVILPVYLRSKDNSFRSTPTL